MDLPVTHEPDKRGDDDIDQHQRQQDLPGDAHQLIVAEARERTAQPDVEEQEEDEDSSSHTGAFAVPQNIPVV